MRAQDGVPKSVVARQSPAQGIAMYAGGVFVLCIMDAIIKWLSADYSIAQIVFFRAVIGLVPTLAMLLRPPGLLSLKTRRFGAHLLRGLVSLVGTFGFFWALAVMPLGAAYAIGFAAPMFITAMSVPILHESVGLKRWLAVLVGFAGVLIMIRPGVNGAFGGGAIALVATAAYALSMVMVRLYSRTESNVAMIFYGNIVVIAATGVQMPFLWLTPGWGDGGLLALVGLLGGVGTLMLAQAYRMATPSIVVPFEYTGMIWGVALSFFIWGDIPDLWTWIGSLVVIGSGLYMLHRAMKVTSLPSRR
ncbi:DMT family transporter [Mesorhizobium sp.]|uniref:DMT family transporter n=1 Tax=Mesorhizobium sp. TaxID=1871066 RepID=UPI000FE94F38|nr:DMT family transporter [Mesorhizobium sp.]RWN26444.1 MAG: DMT family transporter [Mesorhizobium sp.]